MKKYILKQLFFTHLFIAFFAILISVQDVSAQGVSINSSGAAPDASSMLDIAGAGKGLLIPRMTWAARPGTGVDGLLIYVTDAAGPNGKGFYYYNSTLVSWAYFGSGGVTAVTASGPLASTGGNTPNITLSGTVGVANGGTGLTAVPTNGQLPIGNGTGYTLSTITGTANQVNVTNGGGSITLSAPQNIHTAATPTFAGLTVSGLTATRIVMTGAGGILQVVGAPGANQFLQWNGASYTWAASSSTLSNLTQGTGITAFSYNGSAAGTVGIANTGVAAAAYNSSIAGQVLTLPSMTVNAQGQLTAASTSTVNVEVPLTFNSGITRTVNTVQLGGTLLQNTAVNQSTFGLTLGGGTGAININDASSTAVTNIGTTGTTGTVTIGNAANNINLPKLNVSSLVVTDASKNLASFAYGTSGDVLTSAGAGVAPVWSAANTIMPLANNGININTAAPAPATGQVELGGTLVRNTSVAQAGFTFTLGGGTGAVSINTNSTTATTNIGTGTTTGAVTIGGTGTQTISVGNGAGAKTVNLGSATGSSATNILAGTGAVNINVNNNQATNINSGTSTSNILIGNASNYIGIGGAVNAAYKVNVTGKVKSNGINESSDIRWKKNIAPIENGLSKVMAMKGVTYDWRKDEFPDNGFDTGTQYGLIAQDLEKVIPELVATDDNGYKSIEYSHLVPVLIEAIKELKGIVELQNGKISTLSSEISKLQNSNTSVEYSSFKK